MELFAFLYWYVLALLFGFAFAFALRLRPRWLIYPMVVLAAFPTILFLREGLVEALLLGLSMFSYVAVWSAGVVIGKGIRKRGTRV